MTFIAYSYKDRSFECFLYIQRHFQYIPKWKNIPSTVEDTKIGTPP